MSLNTSQQLRFPKLNIAMLPWIEELDTLGIQTFVSRKFRDFREFWPIRENLFFKNSRLSDSRKFMPVKKIKNKIFFQDLKYFQVLYSSKQKRLNINKFKLNLI